MKQSSNEAMKKKAFGLLEVLLAGVIIIIILGALVFIARAALNNATYLQQRSQATFLAQEGIEIVRQIRDSNYIDGDNTTKWNTFIGNTYNIAVNPADTYYIKPSPIPGARRLYYLNTNIENNIIGGTEYTRTIKFDSSLNQLLTKIPPLGGVDINPNSSNAYKVTVMVAWSYQGQDKEIKLEELVANSRQGF